MMLVARMDTRIARLQINLAHLGYTPGHADGIEGGDTDTAIAKFRADQGMPAGKIDDALYSQVESALSKQRSTVPVLSRETVEAIYHCYSSSQRQDCSLHNRVRVHVGRNCRVDDLPPGRNIYRRHC